MHPGQDGIRVLHALTFISIGGGGSKGGERESGEGLKYCFNVLNTITALDVSPEQPVLIGQLLRGEGMAAGPGEMLISALWVEFWGFFFSCLGLLSWVQAKCYK